ncbi:MAG: hypothetical protein IT257_07275 [Chitinophagaceae bacterium]|nr:hypothetical protein [Chitinophagaceae bacterium]
MKSIFAAIVIVWVSAVTLFAQTDSLKREILNYKDEKTETIIKGRKLTMATFLAGDKKKVSELLQYLQTLPHEDYLVFYPAEEWLLYYWTQQYRKLLEGVRAFDSAYIAKLSKQLKPPGDLMMLKMKDKFSQSRQEIKRQISQSDLTETEKQFLALNYDYLISPTADQTVTQDTLNISANKFLKDHPASEFEKYVRKYIRHEYIASKWALTCEFFTGFGNFTGQLADSFKNNWSLGIAFDICYKKWSLYMREYFGFSSTKDSLHFEGANWRKNAKASITLMEASFGYAIIDNRYLNMSPFAGLSYTDISPTEKDNKKYPEYENIGLKYSLTYTVGFNVDYKLKFMQRSDDPSYGFVRLRYAYNKPQFTKRYSGFDGNYHYLTIGVGVLIRNTKRRQ